MNVSLYDFKSFAMRMLNSKMIKGYDPSTGKDLFDLSKLQSCIVRNILKYKDQFAGAVEHYVCTDGSMYWRKDYYPDYKISRVQRKLEYNIDWEEYDSECASTLMTLSEMGFNILEFQNLEADDIIASIVRGTPHKFIIFSADHDYYQLVEKARVSLYNTRDDRFVTLDISPKEYLFNAIFTGQKKDDIPNIMTPLDHEVGRCPGFGPKAWEKVKNMGMMNWLNENKEKILVLNKMENATKYPLLQIEKNDAYERYVANRILVDMDLVLTKGYGDQVLNSVARLI